MVHHDQNQVKAIRQGEVCDQVHGAMHKRLSGQGQRDQRVRRMGRRTVNLVLLADTTALHIIPHKRL